MKSYLELIPVSARIHRRQSRMTRICIALSVFLIAGIFSMADMYVRTQYQQSIQTDGAWQVVFRVDKDLAAMIAARPEVRVAARYAVTNYRLDKDYTIEGTDTALCGLDEAFLSLYPAMEMVEGRYPDASGEAAITRNAARRLGIAPGDSVTLTEPGGKETAFTVTGVVSETAMLNRYDAFGLIVNIDTYSALFAGETEAEDWECYVQFAPWVRVGEAVAQICRDLELDESGVGKNAKLLALTLQSDDTSILGLYLTAGVLAVLVMVAGVLMIASSLNSTVARRTEFFGLLRCVGATPGQVTRFVYLEALIWCRMAVPLALLVSVAAVWGICGMLKALSPNLFDGMPAFGVSWAGLLLGALLGIGTVLLAARSPARRASRVSPLAAVTGNAGTTHAARRAAKCRILPVEAAMGIHHAWGSRKNFAFMAGSFALSIVLFLSFSITVDFMNKAIVPLSPFTPDLSLYDDSRCVIPKETADVLAENPVVDRAYGRSFAYDVPLKAEEMQGTCTLISYEENQFSWARESLLSGSVEDAEQGEGLLAVFNSACPLETGDTVALELPMGTMETRIVGVVSDSPFSSSGSILLCSEAVFERMTGESRYTIVDIQLTAQATEEDVEAIRTAWGEGLSFSDRRMSNQEARGAYYSFAVFVYGFLAIIVLIAACNILNSVAMSVSARMQQFGAMRAIGMSDTQVIRMVAWEAAAYALSGIVLGCGMGLPLHRMLYGAAITEQWGELWTVSRAVAPLAAIVAVIALSAGLSVIGPARLIRGMSVVDTITAK